MQNKKNSLLLKNCDAPVIEVARSIGYENTSFFTKNSRSIMDASY